MRGGDIGTLFILKAEIRLHLQCMEDGTILQMVGTKHKLITVDAKLASTVIFFILNIRILRPFYKPCYRVFPKDRHE